MEIDRSTLYSDDNYLLTIIVREDHVLRKDISTFERSDLFCSFSTMCSFFTLLALSFKFPSYDNQSKVHVEIFQIAAL